jgi:hypothetical protein
MSEAFVKTLRRDYARVTPLPDARTVLGPVEGWITDCNASPQRTSRCVTEGKRLSCRTTGPAGCFPPVRAPTARWRAAGPSSSVRRKSHGPSGSGCRASMPPRSAARRSVFGATPAMDAARVRLGHGSTPSLAGRQTGIRGLERNDVTRSRVQRLPLPVLRPVRLSRPAMTSSLARSASVRTASRTLSGLLLRCPRRRLGSRGSVWAPPPNGSPGRSPRPHRRCRRLSRGGACARSALQPGVSGGCGPDGLKVFGERLEGHGRERSMGAASCSAIRRSISVMRSRLRFRRSSSSPVTRRFSGSAAYRRKARSAAYLAASGSRRSAARASPRRAVAWASASRAAWIAAGCTTASSAASTPSSTRKPPNAMPEGAP